LDVEDGAGFSGRALFRFMSDPNTWLGATLAPYGKSVERQLVPPHRTVE
jgi:hypothetical protein